MALKLFFSPSNPPFKSSTFFSNVKTQRSSQIWISSLKFLSFFRQKIHIHTNDERSLSQSPFRRAKLYKIFREDLCWNWSFFLVQGNREKLFKITNEKSFVEKIYISYSNYFSVGKGFILFFPFIYSFYPKTSLDT